MVSCVCLITVTIGILYKLMLLEVGGQPTTSDEDADVNDLVETVKTLKRELAKLKAMISTTTPDKRTG